MVFESSCAIEFFQYFNSQRNPQDEYGKLLFDEWSTDEWSAFDKATSVKEAKVIFETLNEGMVSKTAKSSMVNEIKGSASKATGVIRENRQPIVEVDPMVARWQKLAGIK